jgi:uridine kinase
MECMKIIAIAAVTAGGKTTIVNELKKQIPNTLSLHFDDYSFEGEVENFHDWVVNGADYNVWNLSPLKEDIDRIRLQENCDYLLLDYPFAYCHETLKEYIDCAIFIDTPLDIAMARRVLRDMKDATADEIRKDMEIYLKFARVAYMQMLKDILPSSDYVIDGAKELEEKVGEIKKIMNVV